MSGPWDVPGREYADADFDVVLDAVRQDFCLVSVCKAFLEHGLRWPILNDGPSKDRPYAGLVDRAISRAFRIRVIEKQLDACFCDDGRDLPECAGCLARREELLRLTEPSPY